MSVFFGNMMISLRNSISSTTLNALANATTSSITATVSGGKGTYTYLWKQSGTTCTITTPTAASTTFIGLNTAGTTIVYCETYDTITGNMLQTDSCTITWSAEPSGSISEIIRFTPSQVQLQAILSNATATGYSWSQTGGSYEGAVRISPTNTQTVTVTANAAPTGSNSIIRCIISYSGGTVSPTITVTWGLI